ncbi:UbiH/UbiF family hydroxylase [Phyllobacterium leguminum]|uniref:2-octaprenyl-3-methyl-6-methoxy-1,4-benzoquinol hydroxylase n=1 Tax=Phyllobacterium leguminum TaxID=314237 RepID=A0A318T189_9HYPH|nr:UbiH/UbiF family hydroxylase [Phyllobacterium leguminum]PYE88247.1 2-octaprenyl-3-methyl-6-methoxy-1,4-benzoquinol hydroxylase [Phyllobacterium leguminum]
MSVKIEKQIAIAGSGPAGMIAALALTKEGYEVALIGPSPSENDQRTTALMMPAIEFLKRLGVWDVISSQTAPLATMRIVDATRRLVRSPTVTFHAGEIGEQAFGYNMPNTVLNKALAKAVDADPRIARILSPATGYRHMADHVEIQTGDGSEMVARLLVACDGRNSPAREAADIGARRWTYPQTAIVLSFAHTLDHENISTEFHTEDGPFTQVPLPGRRSSLVWVANPALAEELMSLDPTALAARVEERMHSMLGKVTVETKQQAWPLSGLVPTAFAANRTVLAGEAAHVFPPIGAQGLNLGVRDVETLLKALQADPSDMGAERVTRAYDRSRRPDVLARTGSVDALNRSLLTGFLPAQIARSVGLELLRSFAPLRGFFMREGLKPGSGFTWKFRANSAR